jgi:hypothetical protein
MRTLPSAFCLTLFTFVKKLTIAAGSSLRNIAHIVLGQNCPVFQIVINPSAGGFKVCVPVPLLPADTDEAGEGALAGGGLILGGSQKSIVPGSNVTGS